MNGTDLAMKLNFHKLNPIPKIEVSMGELATRRGGEELRGAGERLA